MAQFVAYNEKVEVNGAAVVSIVEGMGTFRGLAVSILEKHGIIDPVPGSWHSQQAWLDAFREIALKIGDKTLYQIGRKIPENALWPPDVDSVEKGLASIDMAYHMNHRNGPIGKYGFEKTGEGSARMVCNNPYPCEFDRGIISAVVDKFKIPGTVSKVTHDDSQPCRSKGENSCTYLVTW